MNAYEELMARLLMLDRQEKNIEYNLKIIDELMAEYLAILLIDKIRKMK